MWRDKVFVFCACVFMRIWYAGLLLISAMFLPSRKFGGQGTNTELIKGRAIIETFIYHQESSRIWWSRKTGPAKEKEIQFIVFLNYITAWMPVIHSKVNNKPFIFPKKLHHGLLLQIDFHRQTDRQTETPKHNRVYTITTKVLQLQNTKTLSTRTRWPSRLSI